MEYDEAFFERVLKSHYNDTSIKVLSIDDDSPETEIGRHFLSRILQVRVKFARSSSSENGANCCVSETINLFVKQEPAAGSELLEMVQEEQFFSNEYRVLKLIVPRIEAALGVRLGPKLVYGTNESPMAIIMEDLSREGFCIKNNLQGLSMAHATMAIQNLARFHAGSVMLFEENPENIRRFKHRIFNARMHPNMFILIENGLKRLCEDAENWADEKISSATEKLKKVLPLLKDRLLNVYEYEEDEFCVLNHGDARINNMLFKEDGSGSPLKHVFVDHQLVGFSSPAIDLLYFLGGNLALEVRGEGEEALLETYLDTLTSSMKKLGCKTEPPTMRHLKEAMHRRRAYAVVTGLYFLPRFILDERENENVDELLQSGTLKINPYENPHTIRIMKRMLPLMSDRGYLDP